MYYGFFWVLPSVWVQQVVSMDSHRALQHEESGVVYQVLALFGRFLRHSVYK